MFSFKVDDKDLIKSLQSLGPRCKPLLRKTLRPLANKVKAAVKPLMPKRTGALRKSLAVKPIKSKKFYTVGFRVFARNVGVTDENPKGKYYAFAPEYGVKRGRGKQPAKAFFKKGADVAASYLPACKEAIAKAVADEFNRR